MLASKFWLFITARLTLQSKIVLGNVAILTMALLCVPYVSGYRQGLIEQQSNVMQQHAQVIAAVLAEQLPEDSAVMSFSDEHAKQLLRLVAPSGTRARLYNPEGALLADTHVLQSPPVIVKPLHSQWSAYMQSLWQQWLTSGYPLYPETVGLNGKKFDNVQQAFNDQASAKLYRTLYNDMLLTVAVPVKRVTAVRAVLLLSDEGNTISRLTAREHLNMFLLAAVAVVPLTLWLLYVSFIVVRPLRLLARAAHRLQKKNFSPHVSFKIPDFSTRQDEIGQLSHALNLLLQRLSERIQAAESFAADVAHELKNPLTSLRMAVENVTRMADDTRRQKLLGIMQHDIRRFDRLINDIAKLSRLDAQMWRESFEKIDLSAWLHHFAEQDAQNTPHIALRVHIQPNIWVMGVATRLAQVLHNLVDNARSFSPADSMINITLSVQQNMAVLTVDDSGCGIPPHALERIFERFYSDRTAQQSFGQNSGLGLNICRHIMQSHQGTITASNRLDNAQLVIGARFTVTLPLCHT